MSHFWATVAVAQTQSMTTRMCTKGGDIVSRRRTIREVRQQQPVVSLWWGLLLRWGLLMLVSHQDSQRTHYYARAPRARARGAAAPVPAARYRYRNY
eukprot:SAG31_NODE_512_length_14721_cov_17.995623_9_plen_97_part_00